MTTSATTRPWRWLDPQRGGELTDARLQLHHAAQFATALGISFLPAQPDDSHTNLEWVEDLGALVSKAVGPSAIQLAVRPAELAIQVLASGSVIATQHLHDRTIDGALDWIRSQLAEHGLEASRYTLGRHYEIPSHAVDRGGAFDATAGESFQELANWYSNAAVELSRVAEASEHASPVRCWPHHFDIATLLQVAPGKTISVGMEPGDHYYDEPYFYASLYPSPKVERARPALDGGGVWHTHEWIGAVLPARLVTAADQQTQVRSFLASAVEACCSLLL
jgi:hypothetical protein